MHQQRRGERERGRKGRRGVCMYIHTRATGTGAPALEYLQGER